MPPLSQGLGIDAQRVARHARQRIERGDPLARPPADRLARRCAERQRRLDRLGERCRVARAERASRSAARAARRAARQRSRARRRRRRRWSARPAAAASIDGAGHALGLASREDHDARADEGGRPVGLGAGARDHRLDAALRRRARRVRAQTPAFAASPASTKRTSSKPRLTISAAASTTSSCPRPGTSRPGASTTRSCGATPQLVADLCDALATDGVGREPCDVETRPHEPEPRAGRADKLRPRARPRSVDGGDHDVALRHRHFKAVRGRVDGPSPGMEVTSGALSLRQAPSATQAEARERACTRSTRSASMIGRAAGR